MQQLGQKFLQKYHCPVYPVVCYCWILLAKIHTKMLSSARASRWKPIWYGTFSIYIYIYILYIVYDVSRHTEFKYQNSLLQENREIQKTIVKSEFFLFALCRIYLHEKMHSRVRVSPPRRLAFLIIDSINIYVIIL